MYVLTSPVHVTHYGKDVKKFALNFNRTRNMHGFEWNKIKSLYTEQMLPLVQFLPTLNKVRITYTLYLGSNHKSDVMNWVSVVDKFFQDVLVKAGKLTDDNFTYVPEIVGKFGGVDKDYPRMDILIEEI